MFWAVFGWFCTAAEQAISPLPGAGRRPDEPGTHELDFALISLRSWTPVGPFGPSGEGGDQLGGSSRTRNKKGGADVGAALSDGPGPPAGVGSGL